LQRVHVARKGETCDHFFAEHSGRYDLRCTRCGVSTLVLRQQRDEILTPLRDAIWAVLLREATTRAAAEARVRELEVTVAFFASVIRSGEGWSETCQQHLDAARQAGEVEA